VVVIGVVLGVVVGGCAGSHRLISHPKAARIGISPQPPPPRLRRRPRHDEPTDTGPTPTPNLHGWRFHHERRTPDHRYQAATSCQPSLEALAVRQLLTDMPWPVRSLVICVALERGWRASAVRLLDVVKLSIEVR
jgi:hypothetical protein